MAKADALSRCMNLKKRIESDNKNVTLLKPEFFHVHALYQDHLLIEEQEKKLLSQIRLSKDHKDAVVRTVKELKQSGIKMIRSDKWTLEQGLVLYRGKVYILKNIKLQTEIIKLHHDSSVAGYSGQWKTLELILHNYWWLGITQKVNNYVSGCHKCQ